MSSWRCIGQNERIEFEKELSPYELMEELNDYRQTFGENFGIKDLLKIYDIKAKIRIAANIMDLPEQFVHEMTLAENDGHGIASAVCRVAENMDN